MSRPTFCQTYRDVEWHSRFIAMLYDEFEAGVIGERALAVGLALVRDHSIE